MQVSIDEGIFWNQWYIFKQLYPISKQDQEAKGPLKVLKMKTFVTLFFKDDETMFIGKEEEDLTT